MFETWVVRVNECQLKRQVRRHITDIFSIFFNMKLYCGFSLESPRRGDSNEYTKYTICNIKKKIILNYSKSAARFFKEAQTRVRISVVNEPAVVEPPMIDIQNIVTLSGIKCLFKYSTKSHECIRIS